MSYKKTLATIAVIVAILAVVSLALNPAYSKSYDEYESVTQDHFVGDISDSYYAPFKMDLPSGVSCSFQGGAVLNHHESKSSSTDPFDDHPFIVSSDDNFELDYINFTDDSFENRDDVMANSISFEGSKFMSEKNGVYVYDIGRASHFDDYNFKFAACKEVDGGVVIVSGVDLDDCIRMASSVEPV